MNDENERSVASDGSVAGGSLGAFVAWRDEKLAKGEHDVNPYMVWCAGVRYAALTDAERKAIKDAIECCEDITYGGAADQEAADVLKALLKRTK